jgi:hypothetical protein
MYGSISSDSFTVIQELYDFTLCERKDGTVYGTRGKCRKGVETTQSPDKREERKKALEKDASELAKKPEYSGGGPEALQSLRRDYKMLRSLVIPKGSPLNNLENRARLINIRLEIAKLERASREQRPRIDPKRYQSALNKSPKYEITPGNRTPLKRDLNSAQDSLSLARIYEEQKFNSKPELVGTVSDLRSRNDTLRHPDGSPIVLYRGVSSTAFANQFRGIGKEGDIHYPGRGIFGNGTYSAAASALSPGVTESNAISTARDYAGVRKGANNRIVASSIRSDANVVLFSGETARQREQAFRDWSIGVIKEAERVTGYKFGSDVGQAAAALGIHAYQVPQYKEDYFVILNRGAVIASMDSELSD